MNTHDTVIIDGCEVLRVVGGWIYFDRTNKISTFVPFIHPQTHLDQVKFKVTE